MTNQNQKVIKYITVGDESKKWGLYITGAGNIKVGENTEYPLVDDPSHHYFHWSTGRRLSEYQIIYITKGRGIFESEQTGPKRINTGDVFMLFPEVWHRFKPDKRTGWDEYWVEFDGDLLNYGQIQEVLNPANPVINIGVHSEVTENFNKIIENISEQKPGFQHLASGNLFQIIAQIFAFKKYKQFEGKLIERQIEQAKSYIFENLNKTISQMTVALEVGLGYSLYRKKFKEYTGLSPRQYQIHLRITKAKYLLETTDKPLVEIAYWLGFESNDYFHRIFKKKTNQTPINYRKKNRK